MNYKCMWMFICTSFGSMSAILFISSPIVVISLGVKISQCYNDTGDAAEKPLWLLLHKQAPTSAHSFGTLSPSVTHKRGSSRLRDVRTIASIYAGQERVDEELHVLPLNYHAPTASGHNGPWCSLGTHSETRQTAKIACGWSVIRGWNIRCETCDARDDSGT